MWRSHLSPVLVAASAAVSLAGCGITDPYARRHVSRPKPQTPTTAARTSTDADPLPERGGTIPAGGRAAESRLTDSAGQPTPQAALAQFARIDINWSARTVESAQQQLAAISIDQARAQALQAAVSYRSDATLQASAVANSGRIVTIAQSLATPGQWVVVTSEQTTGKGDYVGLPPTVHVTYAQVTRVPSGWVVSQWAPQT